MSYVPKAKNEMPSDFHFSGSELEVSINQDGSDLGLVIAGMDRYFRVAVGDAGAYIPANKVALGFKDELSRELLQALNAWAANEGYVKFARKR